MYFGGKSPLVDKKFEKCFKRFPGVFYVPIESEIATFIVVYLERLLLLFMRGD